VFFGPTVTVSVRDARPSQSDRLWIGSIYREYLDDLATLSTGIFPVLGEVGHREPDQIARWFGDRNAFPLVILKTTERVGFAMVARSSQPPQPPVVEYRMAEFFISRVGAWVSAGRPSTSS
jgi:hypothetical protein